VDTGTLPTEISVPVEVPPGSWRREATHFPSPVSPFLAGAIPVVGAPFRAAFAGLGTYYDTLEYRNIGGWVYTRLVPPGGMDGVAPDPDLIAERAALAAEAVRSDNLDGYLEEWSTLRDGFITGVARFRAVNLRSFDDEALAGHFGDVMAFSLDTFNVHFRLHGIYAMMLTDLAWTCRDLLGWDDAEALALLRGLSEASTEPSNALAGLTALARERPAVRRFLESGAGDASALPDIDQGFADAFAGYHEGYGLRTVHYDVADQSIEETPALTLRLVADQLRGGYDPAARASEAARQRETRQQEARRLLADRPDADRARFEQALQRAQRWYGVREEKATMTWNEPTGLIRRVVLEMGRRLAESSLLDDPEDVFFLVLEEASAALAARHGATAPQCREIVRRRRSEQAWAEAHPGPLSYGPDFDPRAALEGLPEEIRFVTEAQLWLIERGGHYVTTPPQAAGSRLVGIGASDGIYTGTARVVLSEADFGKVQPRDVLVCPTTSPAWSVLFPNVGALVTDAGAVLAHPAIIAREFQIPAVVATGNATSLIHDGQRVKVDGAAGSVEVIA
jgi:rifampicin phosphotransferase